MSIKVSGNGMADIKKALSFLENTRCLVGIPQEHSSRRDDEINNAELAFIHTYGSPKRNIPPRPFIEPAIEQSRTRKEITKLLQSAAIKAIEGDTSAALADMHEAGICGENAVKDYIGSSNLTPNSEATIKRKGSSAPLIDTDSLHSSVTHVIEER